MESRIRIKLVYKNEIEALTLKKEDNLTDAFKIFFSKKTYHHQNPNIIFI